MNSAELTALHAETLFDFRRARTLANIARRAETLWTDGYALGPVLRITGYDTYTVTSPAGAAYGVYLSDTPTDLCFGDKCECPAFAKFGECKHHLAVRSHLRDEEQCDLHDAEASACYGDDYADRFMDGGDFFSRY